MTIYDENGMRLAVTAPLATPQESSAKGAPVHHFGEGTENFQVMREWNRSEIYRKTMVLFSERLK